MSDRLASLNGVESRASLRNRNARSFSVPSLLALFLAVLVCFVACEECNPVRTPDVTPEWVSLGFEDKLPLRMKASGGSLYVCTGRDGLWRIDLASQRPQWESLGFIDTTYVDWWLGVSDVDVKGDDILVAIQSKRKGNTGVWRSRDVGRSWAESDSGIPTPDYPYSSVYSVARSPDSPSIGFASTGAGFRTVDGGSTWTLLGESRSDISNPIYVEWNKSINGEIWAYGQTGRWTPVVSRSSDWGESWNAFSFLNEPQVMAEAVAFDLAFGPATGSTIYAAIGSIVCKSVDGGTDWIVPIHRDPQSRPIKSVVCHSSIEDLVYFGIGSDVYISRDGGRSLELVENEIDSPVLSMTFDDITGVLLVGDWFGVYQLLNAD